jgi:ribosome biogenesis GTPase
MKERPNRHERHLNKKAQEKKERAKLRSFSKPTSLIYDDNLSTDLEQGIIVEIKGEVFIVMKNDKLYECNLKKTSANLISHLVIGDKVNCELENNTGSIDSLLPRQSYLSRFRGDYQRISLASYEEHVIAANIDIGLIVTSAKDPDFHPRLIDRYLIACENGNVTPVICLNKADLVTELPPELVWYENAGIPVIETSTETGEGINTLKDLIRDKISVLVGHSGVGKSSLVNSIIPEVNIITNSVSAKSRKGRHTTTSSRLFQWDNNSYIIDTPGIRSLGLQHIDINNLKYSFKEFENYSLKCKYSDCSHSHEPDCGVKDAVKNGEIPIYRYESYIRMLSE